MIPRGTIVVAGYPSFTVASTTTTGFINFMTPSISRNSTGSALTMRLDQSALFETRAAHADEINKGVVIIHSSQRLAMVFSQGEHVLLARQVWVLHAFE